MRQTQNYQLSQWERADRILMEDFNTDNEKVDTALKTLAGQVAAKAETAALAAEQSARTAADAAVREKVTELESRAGAQFIRTVTLENSGSSVSLPLGEIDWEAWKAVHLSLDVYMAQDYNVEVRVGSAVCGYLRGNTTPPGEEEDRRLIHLILYPLYDRRHPVCPIFMDSNGAGIAKSASTFHALGSVSLYNPNTTILAGTRCAVWGEK